VKRDTKEAIAFPSAIFVAILCAYGLIKLIKSLPAATSDEAIFGGMIILAGLGVPFFFGCMIAIVALCMWLSTEDRP
jgi:hypothetical protein